MLETWNSRQLSVIIIFRNKRDHLRKIEHFCWFYKYFLTLLLCIVMSSVLLKCRGDSIRLCDVLSLLPMDNLIIHTGFYFCIYEMSRYQTFLYYMHRGQNLHCILQTSGSGVGGGTCRSSGESPANIIQCKCTIGNSTRQD